MALFKDITTEYGVTIPAAYVRVDDVSMTKQRVVASARFYADTQKPPFADHVFAFKYQLDGPNPIKQAYEHLKSLPEFADAVDC
jgi:hypothetical protein